MPEPSTWSGHARRASARAGGPRDGGPASRGPGRGSAPIPPVATTTASAEISNGADDLAGAGHRARGPVVGEHVAPHAGDPAVRRDQDVTRCRNRTSTRPSRRARRAGRGRTARGSPGPVPHVTWNRGTELPCPSARYPPRSAHCTSGNQRTPWRVQPRAQVARRRSRRTPSAQARPQRSEPVGRRSRRSPNQSASASSAESLTPRRRCSGESTRNSPPNDQNACPPRLAARLRRRAAMTRRPAATSSAVATRPARPAPTTTTSECVMVRTLRSVS